MRDHTPYDDRSMDRQAVQRRRAGGSAMRVLFTILRVLAIFGLALILFSLSGCPTVPTNTPWCPDAARDARNACMDEYGPGRRGVTGYGHTDGYQWHCMMVGHAERQRCER